MARLLLVFLFLSLSACSVQKPFPGVIFIRNTCNAPLPVSVTKFSGYISSLEGNEKENFTLAVGQKKHSLNFSVLIKNRVLNGCFQMNMVVALT